MVFTHSWQLVALSPTLAFSGAFVAEGERFLTGGCYPEKQIQGGSHRGSTFKFVRLENMFAQFQFAIQFRMWYSLFTYVLKFSFL